MLPLLLALQLASVSPVIPIRVALQTFQTAATLFNQIGNCAADKACPKLVSNEDLDLVKATVGTAYNKLDLSPTQEKQVATDAMTKLLAGLSEPSRVLLLPYIQATLTVIGPLTQPVAIKDDQ